MNKVCKLCTKDHNEDVGSHIFTESIIRTAINQEGEIRRSDKEIIFQAGRNKVRLKYFGSSVLPEKLESIIGETISDDLIEANKDNNPFINKDLVCRKCERRFNPVETKFFNNIYSKIHIPASESFKKHTCNFITFEKVDCIINVPNTLNIGICSDEDRIKLIKRIGEREMDKIISDSDKKFIEEYKKHLGIYPSIAAIKLYRYKIIEYIISVRLDMVRYRF